MLTPAASFEASSLTRTCRAMDSLDTTGTNTPPITNLNSKLLRRKRIKSPRNRTDHARILSTGLRMYAAFLLTVCVLEFQQVLVFHSDHMAAPTVRKSLATTARHAGEATSTVRASATIAELPIQFIPQSTHDGNSPSFLNSFQSKLSQWRRQTTRQSPQFANNKVSPTSRLLSQSQQQQKQQLSVPFWDQQLLFQKRNSWKLMAAILATDCMTQSADDYLKNGVGVKYPSLLTLQDALTTKNAAILLYLPQAPTSSLFPIESQKQQETHQLCQAKLIATIKQQYAVQLKSGQLQLVHGIVNPLPLRIANDYHHQLPHVLQQLKDMHLPIDPIDNATLKVQKRLQLQQLELEQKYSLGLDFSYIAELVYNANEQLAQCDLLLFLTAGTRLTTALRQQLVNDPQNARDYASTIIQHYENFQQRLSSHDHLVHHFCYLTYLQEYTWNQLPGVNATVADQPPRFQQSLDIPTGIVLERYQLYRLAMALRTLLPYHKQTTSQLLSPVYCENLLWETQILQPINTDGILVVHNATTEIDESAYPPALFQVKVEKEDTEAVVDVISADVLAKEIVEQKKHLNSGLTIPSWVQVDNRQLGPQRYTNAADIYQIPSAQTLPLVANSAIPAADNNNRKLVTFVVPTSARPNGINDRYVIASLNQLFPLIKRDLMLDNGQLQASVLLVICGNTQEDVNNHQNGLWEYYGPEIQSGILEIFSTNLETYPSLHDLPNNYGDVESRLRWRSKQNLDISSSLFAAKGKSDYIMLLEDDTGYRDKFTLTLKAMIDADQRQEGALVPDPKVTGMSPVQDFRQHIWSQIHFGFGYSGVLIHDDDTLVYAVLHYVLMDEKPCDLLFLANHLQGKVLDQEFRWQRKMVLLTHIGSVSSLKGKLQPVWGLEGQKSSVATKLA